MRLGDWQLEQLLSWYIRRKQKAHWKWYQLFETSVCLVTHFQQGHTCLSFPNSSNKWEPSIQTWSFGGHCYLSHYTFQSLLFCFFFEFCLRFLIWGILKLEFDGNPFFNCILCALGRVVKHVLLYTCAIQVTTVLSLIELYHWSMVLHGKL